MNLDWANWFAGFCDGEACFMIAASGSPGLQIALRADDVGVLHEIRNVLGIGTVKASLTRNAYVYAVYGRQCLKIADLLSGRLRSKKSRNLAIWLEALQASTALGAKRTSRRKELMLEYRAKLQEVRNG